MYDPVSPPALERLALLTPALATLLTRAPGLVTALTGSSDASGPVLEVRDWCTLMPRSRVCFVVAAFLRSKYPVLHSAHVACVCVAFVFSRFQLLAACAGECLIIFQPRYSGFFILSCACVLCAFSVRDEFD